MSLRLRERRQRNTYAGVVRGSGAVTSEQPIIDHSSQGRIFVRWRLVSFLIIVGLSAILALFFVTGSFYIRSVSVSGLNYLTKEEIFTYTELANMHIFWVNPDEVRQNILRAPSIADVRVTLGWPPNMVRIVVDEREPVMIWEYNGEVNWVDLQGRLLVEQEQRENLLRVSVVATGFESDLQIGEQVPTNVVHGALQLRDLLPNISTFLYHPTNGLGYRTESGWEVWFGVGTNMIEKYFVYQSIAEDLRSRGIQPGQINVTNPDAPYYSVLWGR